MQILTKFNFILFIMFALHGHTGYLRGYGFNRKPINSGLLQENDFQIRSLLYFCSK